VGDASVLTHPPVDRRRAWLTWLAPLLATVVAMAATTTGLGRLDGVGRSAQAPPLLRGSFLGPSTPDVRLVPLVTPAPTRTRPIDVPADPYAPEEILEIGTIEIPKLGVQQRLMYGVTLRNIDLGPSHWPGSALPGDGGNMVVAGHRVTHSRPFRNIDQLTAGDEVVVNAKGRKAIYRVAFSFVVTPDRTDIANETETPSLTLFACHPPGSARQRFVVRADLVRAEAV
jgi:sortase A